LSIAAVVYGCGSDEAPLENLCGFLGDQNNCERTFFDHVGAECGALGKGNGPKGTFLGRDALDVCVLEQGGTVVFDPALDLTQFPLQGPVTMKFIDVLGGECGSASFAGTYNYSVTVASFPPDAGPPQDAGDPTCANLGTGSTTSSSTTTSSSSSGAGGAGGGTGAGGGMGTGAGLPTGQVLCGGTFSATTPDGRDILDLTCPNNETHHFNRLQISKCGEYAGVLPHAEIESNPGGVSHSGLVTFRVYYPPPSGPLENKQSEVVEYFQCSIPGAPIPCANGVKDLGETDVDCGGMCSPCQVGLACVTNKDCASNTCVVDPKNGLKKCADAPASGAGGGGGGGAGAGGGGGKGGA
jgi:hypothetical protein